MLCNGQAVAIIAHLLLHYQIMGSSCFFGLKKSKIKTILAKYS